MALLKTSSVVIYCFLLLPIFEQRYPKKVCSLDEPADLQELESKNTSVSSSDVLYTYLAKINTALNTPYAKYIIRNIAEPDKAASHYQRFGAETLRVITISKSYYENLADNATDREALLIWILAHEASHHTHGDIGFDDKIEGKNLIKEILADQRAGYAVGKATNISIDFFDTYLPKILSYTSHTSTHPSRRYRIMAAKGGWLQAKMENVSDGGTKVIGGVTYKNKLESDGDRVWGEYSNTDMNGIGMTTYTDGDIYMGNKKDGSKSGYGLYLYKDGASDFSSIFFGKWSNDRINGKGAKYWLSGDKYEGEFKDSQKNGYGTYYWPSGNKYVGEWANDNMNGYGTLYYTDGRIFQGLWKDDKRHGQGVLYQGSTVIQSGCWQNGTHVGETCN
ncbi:MAG: hypothetical protein KIS77_18815 [Saprospiraceae bacterium]|nr:hypothetical protein [Saprospiraceae bacterium]